MNHKYLITVAGPTAIGKTSLSIALSKNYKTEIISCDSRQFYKEMAIGTAVPGQEELNAAKHHFIQNRSVFEDYSVGDFEKDALKKLEEIFKDHSVAIMVGGSGFYADAVLKGLDDFPEVDPEIRIDLKEEMKEKGIVSLQKSLQKLDPDTYAKIDTGNPQRLIRALEICKGTGKAYSTFLNKKKQKRNFIPVKIGLTADREIIYNRINQRVDMMMEQGLLKEAGKLYPYKDLNALQTVGYRELFKYFDGEFTLEFAVSEIKKNTRRFAKRQITWYKKDPEIKWFTYQTEISEIIKFINHKMNL